MAENNRPTTRLTKRPVLSGSSLANCICPSLGNNLASYGAIGNGVGSGVGPGVVVDGGGRGGGVTDGTEGTSGASRAANSCSHCPIFSAVSSTGRCFTAACLWVKDMFGEKHST